MSEPQYYFWCSIWHTMPQVRVLLNHWNNKVYWPGGRYSRNITVQGSKSEKFVLLTKTVSEH